MIGYKHNSLRVAAFCGMLVLLLLNGCKDKKPERQHLDIKPAEVVNTDSVLAKEKHDSDSIANLGPQVDKDGVFTKVDKMPTIPGGQHAVDDYVQEHVHYPEEALKEKLMGRVVVQVTIDENGKLYSPKVLRSTNKIFNKEALRVVRSMPKWEAGKLHGRPVTVRTNINVYFRPPIHVLENANM